MIDCLSQLAPSWRESLKEAVELADEELILELLQALPAEQTPLCQTIHQLVDEFQYGTLLDRLAFPSDDENV